jgi:hypothetical protein
MCCDAPTPPAPDPAIGQAAQANAALGQAQLDWAKQTYADSQARQDVYDNLIGKVVNSDIATQDQANAWAKQDRDLGMTGKAGFDALADQAVAKAHQYEGALNGIAGTYGGQASSLYGLADKQQGRYTSTFAPIEDKIASDAMNWDSADRLDSESAKARGDVLTSSAAARDASARNLASMGINPASGRFAGQQRAADIQEALGAAGAENVARDNIRSQAQQLRGQAAQLGQQVLGSSTAARSLGLQATNAQQNATQAASGVASAGITQEGQLKASGLGAAGVGYQGLGVGLTAGNSAVGNQGAGQSSFIANQGIMNNGFSGAMAGNSSAANILNTQYGNQLQGWGMAQQAGASSASGLGSLVGTIGGLGLKAYGMGLFSSKDFKTGKHAVTGALEAVNRMPVEGWKYKDGIADGGEHIGPYAEDFQRVTGKGDGKVIPVVDAIGVTMKAVQELSAKVDGLKREGARA